MNILHVIQRYHPARGGAEIHLEEISAYLVAQGHQVTVATTDALDFELFWSPWRRRVKPSQAWHRGVRILRFPVHHLPIAPLAYPAWRRLLWLLSNVRVVPVALLFSLAKYTPWVPELRKWLASTDESFDLVMGMTICFEALLEAGLRFARRHDIPYLIFPLTHLGAGDKPGQDALSRFYTMRHQIALVQRSDAMIAQTPTEREFYVGHGVPESRISVIGPGVTPAEVLGGDGKRFRQRHQIKGPLVVSLSTMSYDKGTVHLVKAVRRLWQAGYQVTLVLAGALLTPFQRYLDSLPISDRQRLRVLGFVNEEEKRDLLAAADIFAMPSRTDSFGIVYLEAWLYEKPVIGAHTWGVCDVITDGVDGILVPFGDVPALSRALIELLEDDSLRDEMGARGAKKVYRLHTWKHKHHLIENLYNKLLSPERLVQ